MKKIVTLIIVCVICMNTFGNHISFAEEENNTGQFSVNAKAAIIMEPVTGKVIFEQNSHEKLKPASVTKIMTILLIYDAVDSGQLNWEDEVVISEYAASMGGSQVFLEPNEVQTVKDLTKCIVIASANDGAVAMAEKIAGSEEAFANMMNEKAKALGMLDTHFVNACGLDIDDHYTSAHDIALMSRELISKYPEVLETSQIWQDSIIHRTKRGEEEFGLTNTNKLLKWYNGATGLKTGSTSKALYCLSGTAKRNDLELIAVVMAAPDWKTRFKEVMRMFDHGFAVCRKYHDPIKESFEQMIEVKKGVMLQVKVKPVEDYNMIITDKKIDINNIEKKIVMEENIEAPVEKGQEVGQVEYYHEGTKLGEVVLETCEEVSRIDFKYCLHEVLRRILALKR